MGLAMYRLIDKITLNNYHLESRYFIINGSYSFINNRCLGTCLLCWLLKFMIKVFRKYLANYQLENCWGKISKIILIII